MATGEVRDPRDPVLVAPPSDADRGLPHNPMSRSQESALFKELKASSPFFLMAGPNVIQSEEHCLRLCRQIKAVTGTNRCDH